MSTYGKLDESEQERLVARRKTRRRIAVMSLSAVVLVGVVVAAVLGTSLAHNNDKDDKNNSSSNNVDISASVKAVCDVTLYKDACYASLGRVVQPGQVMKPEDLFRLSLQVALDEVSNAADKYFSGKKGAFKDLIGDDNRTMESFRNCKELLDLAIDHLNVSLSSGQNSSVLDLFEDLQTWLSATGTYQQTCIDGLEEAKGSIKNRISSYLKNSTEFTSNSLAIITWIQQATSTLNLRRRRLLTLPNNNEAPAWLHQKDRKLLASDKDLKKRADIVVAKDGSGKYRTISEALKHVPEESKKRTVIYVKKGLYYENVRVEKKKWNVMMIGDGMTRTIVSGSLNFVDGTPTFSSATFAVFGKNFMARDIGFRNTAGPQKHQAVALMTSADQAVYYRCLFDAFQDTLYAHSHRQFYRECNIFGTVDFIFGNSAVVIQNSNIFPKVPMLGQKNTITAQGKVDPNMNTGISIQNCRISPFGNLSSVQTYLGRPWKNYSTTVFMQSSMGDLIDPSGWLPWVGDSAPDTIFYAEFQNFGPGASTKGRVKWKGLRTISAKQANRFTVKAFLQGDRWIPATITPYKSSL
ncbi:putative pectinesterase/pectinesterase inhibitor 24 [Neltuma alba]|uniref:putative pectinesterase/pectinesterase inhibitor 24 n=1 Tax=Neltuma alba TaxID=207710 RepID=UPI0010A574BF|nr:putative pectinesterase/pectinesterase inhibitor 24 [Prosopis alba]